MIMMYHHEKLPGNTENGLNRVPVTPFEAILSSNESGASPGPFGQVPVPSGALGAPKGPKTLREGPPRGRLPL